MVDRARETALKVLYKIDTEKAYSNIILDKTIKENREKLNEKDLGLISEIVYGVTAWKLTLDVIIRKYSKIRLKKISSWIINILRMGIYQVIFLDKIPKSAAVNESVNLAKRYGHSSSANFVNAVLRKVEKEDYSELFQIKDEKERISKLYSMPQWIVEKLVEEYGEREAENICKNSNVKPKISIRINNLKTNKENLQKLLEERNVGYYETDLKDFMFLDKIKNIENLDLFINGYFTIQDVSAGLTAVILDPKENENILDACAAPGGKTAYIAELMNNKGTVEAWDIHEHRIKLIEQTAKRLGIDIIKTDVKDATILQQDKIEKYDKILLDVPCLGLGVIKRKPDIKWTRNAEDIKEITKIQQKILENCSKYLKKGGIMVYSTCSILKEENETNIIEFLNKNSGFEREEIDGKEFLNILPNNRQDGFFICKLKKI